jgi:hypothetical protein
MTLVPCMACRLSMIIHTCLCVRAWSQDSLLLNDEEGRRLTDFRKATNDNYVTIVSRMEAEAGGYSASGKKIMDAGLRNLLDQRIKQRPSMPQDLLLSALEVIIREGWVNASVARPAHGGGGSSNSNNSSGATGGGGNSANVNGGGGHGSGPHGSTSNPGATPHHEKKRAYRPPRDYNCPDGLRWCLVCVNKAIRAGRMTKSEPPLLECLHPAMADRPKWPDMTKCPTARQ